MNSTNERRLLSVKINLSGFVKEADNMYLLINIQQIGIKIRQIMDERNVSVTQGKHQIKRFF